jgi:hypothetical protein
MPENYFNYFTEIEEYFVRLRGRNLLISPLDWCLIELWKDNRIPLHVVMRGIDRSFESTVKRRKRAPSTLFYCHPAVMEAFEEYREAMLGSEGEEFDAGLEPEMDLPKADVLGHLDRLRLGLERREAEAFERALGRLAAVREEVMERSSTDLAELDRELEQIASTLVSDLREHLDKDEVKHLKAECRKELKVYRKHVSKEVFEQLLAKQLEKKLRERYELPEFSLLTAEI